MSQVIKAVLERFDRAWPDGCACAPGLPLRVRLYNLLRLAANVLALRRGPAEELREVCRRMCRLASSSSESEGGRVAYYLADLLRVASYRWMLKLDASLEAATLWRTRRELWERVGEAVLDAVRPERTESPKERDQTEDESG